MSQIWNMPQEILERIFYFIDDPRTILTIGQVCRHWRSISADENSVFWTNFVTMHPEFTPLLIIRPPKKFRRREPTKILSPPFVASGPPVRKHIIQNLQNACFTCFKPHGRPHHKKKMVSCNKCFAMKRSNMFLALSPNKLVDTDPRMVQMTSHLSLFPTTVKRSRAPLSKEIDLLLCRFVLGETTSITFPAMVSGDRLWVHIRAKILGLQSYSTRCADSGKNIRWDWELSNFKDIHLTKPDRWSLEEIWVRDKEQLCAEILRDQQTRKNKRSKDYEHDDYGLDCGMDFHEDDQ